VWRRRAHLLTGSHAPRTVLRGAATKRVPVNWRVLSFRQQTNKASNGVRSATLHDRASRNDAIHASFATSTELVAQQTANESVPIQLAQCRFPRWPFPMLKYKFIFQIKYTVAILSNSTRKLLWFEITKMIKSNQIYLLKTHHISSQQVVKAVDEQGQQGCKEHLQ